jgi:hypothetical protein
MSTGNVLPGRYLAVCCRNYATIVAITVTLFQDDSTVYGWPIQPCTYLTSLPLYTDRGIKNLLALLYTLRKHSARWKDGSHRYDEQRQDRDQPCEISH